MHIEQFLEAMKSLESVCRELEKKEEWSLMNKCENIKTVFSQMWNDYLGGLDIDGD